VNFVFVATSVACCPSNRHSSERRQKKKYFCNTKHTEIKGYKYLSKAVLKFGSEAWVGTEEKRGTTFRSSTDEIFETLTWKTKLDKEKNQCIRGKNGSREYSKGNKTVPGKVATTHTENGHKQDT